MYPCFTKGGNGKLKYFSEEKELPLKPRICFSIPVHGMKTQKGGKDVHLKKL